MDSSRSTSSQRDTTARSLRDSSSRSRPRDFTRPSNTGYERSYSTHEVAGQGGSPSGYSRGYNTIDARSTASRIYDPPQGPSVSGPDDLTRGSHEHDFGTARLAVTREHGPYNDEYR